MPRTDDVTSWYDFWYINVRKVEGFLSQITGRLEQEQREGTTKQVGGTVHLGVEIGKILAALGLASANASAEVRGDYSRVVEVTTSLTVDNKVILLAEYLNRAGQLARVEVGQTPAAQVARTVTEHPFQILAGQFDYAEGDKNDQAELRSKATTGKGDPVVRVPLLLGNMTMNQAVNALGEDFFPHNVLCRCMIRPNYVLANPIAVWFPYVDPDNFEPDYWQPLTTTAHPDQDLRSPKLWQVPV